MQLRKLQTIREYIRHNQLPPVFRYRPWRLVLETGGSGGAVSLEQTLTGSPIPNNILVWPIVTARVTHDEAGTTVELIESKPGLACSPLEQLYRIRIQNKIFIAPPHVNTDGDSMIFVAAITYEPFALGFEHLGKEQVQLLYSDVIEARPDLAVISATCGKVDEIA